jgi:hypothetical protein
MILSPPYTFAVFGTSIDEGRALEMDSSPDSHGIGVLKSSGVTDVIHGPWNSAGSSPGHPSGQGAAENGAATAVPLWLGVAAP